MDGSFWHGGFYFKMLTFPSGHKISFSLRIPLNEENKNWTPFPKMLLFIFLFCDQNGKIVFPFFIFSQELNNSFFIFFFSLTFFHFWSKTKKCNN